MKENKVLQRDIKTQQIEDTAVLAANAENAALGALSIKMGISSILGTRDSQQDSLFGQTDGYTTLAVVCDGMGGMNGGELASQTAVKGFVEDFYASGHIDDIPRFFRQEAIRLDNDVFSLKDSTGAPLNGGTTIVAAVVRDGLFYWLSVGDSRIYLLRGTEIATINRDHNYKLTLDEKYRMGEIDAEDYEIGMAQGEALISYLGMGDISLIDVNDPPIQLLEGDIILLCSDGLYKRLTDEEIKNIISFEEPDMDRAAKRLTDVVNMRTERSQDNTSLIIMQYNRYNI